MAIATMHLEGVGGHSGPATVYKLDPPMSVGGTVCGYVTIWIDNATRWQSAEVVAIWSNERGASVSGSIIRRAGSYTLHDDFTGQPEYIAGAHLLALTMLGYAIAPPQLAIEVPRPQDS